MRASLMQQLSACLLASAVALAGVCAHAQDQLKDDPRARQFFEVGAQAYAKGQYLLAIDAFQEAYTLTERPGILFSLAQAHQRQFRATGDEQHLTRGIEYYRRYLARVPSGGRHDEASTSLNALLAVLERLHPQNQATPARTQVFGKLLLSSPTPEVKLTVNGEVVETLPTALELPADKYHVVGSAPGFESTSQQVIVVAGSSVPLNLELQPLPSKLQIDGPAGAEAYVDGRSVGWLPLAALALPAGEHWVSLRKSGKKTQSAQVRLQRGQTASVALQLETTWQRSAAWVTGAGAVLGLAVTLPLAVLANARDNEAADLDERRRQQSITPSEGLRLNAALDARNELRAGATIAGIATGALIGSTLVLLLTDTPAPPGSGSAQAGSRAPSRLVSLQPQLGSSWGLSVGAAF